MLKLKIFRMYISSVNVLYIGISNGQQKFEHKFLSSNQVKCSALNYFSKQGSSRLLNRKCHIQNKEVTTLETDYLSLNYNLKLEKANTVGGIIFLYIHTHTKLSL